MRTLPPAIYGSMSSNDMETINATRRRRASSHRGRQTSVFHERAQGASDIDDTHPRSSRYFSIDDVESDGVAADEPVRKLPLDKRCRSVTQVVYEQRSISPAARAMEAYVLLSFLPGAAVALWPVDDRERWSSDAKTRADMFGVSAACLGCWLMAAFLLVSVQGCCCSKSPVLVKAPWLSILCAAALVVAKIIHFDALATLYGDDNKNELEYTRRMLGYLSDL